MWNMTQSGEDYIFYDDWNDEIEEAAALEKQERGNHADDADRTTLKPAKGNGAAGRRDAGADEKGRGPGSWQGDDDPLGTKGKEDDPFPLRRFPRTPPPPGPVREAAKGAKSSARKRPLPVEEEELEVGRAPAGEGEEKLDVPVRKRTGAGEATSHTRGKGRPVNAEAGRQGPGDDDAPPPPIKAVEKKRAGAPKAWPVGPSFDDDEPIAPVSRKGMQDKKNASLPPVDEQKEAMAMFDDDGTEVAEDR
jgi:hypothetical protein